LWRRSAYVIRFKKSRIFEYRLVWAEAKSDATSVILDFTNYFRIFSQQYPRTNPYQSCRACSQHSTGMLVAS
jgi:hypothetical protein